MEEYSRPRQQSTSGGKIAAGIGLAVVFLIIVTLLSLWAAGVFDSATETPNVPAPPLPPPADASGAKTEAKSDSAKSDTTKSDSAKTTDKVYKTKQLCLYTAADPYKSLFVLQTTGTECLPVAGWQAGQKFTVYDEKAPDTKQYCVAVSGSKGQLEIGDSCGTQGWTKQGTFYAYPEKEAKADAKLCVSSSSDFRYLAQGIDNCTGDGWTQNFTFFTVKK